MRPHRTPTVIQMEATECGAACLGIVLGYHGRHVSLAELRTECGVSRDGSQASSVVKAARRYGMTARGFRREAEELRAARLPAVVFWDFSHFLVVEGFTRDRVHLNDPASGRRTARFEDFARSYSGVMLEMVPGEGFQPGGRRPGMASALLGRLRGSRGALLYGVVLGLLLLLPGLAIPMLTQAFVDDVLVRGAGGMALPLVAGMATAAVLRALLTAVQLGSLRALRMRLAVTGSSRFLRHLLHLPLGFYAQRYAGEIGSRLTLNDKVAEVLTGRLATTCIGVTVMLVYAAVMVRYDVALAAVGILFAAANLVALRWISRRRADANIALLQESGKLSGVSIAGVEAMETLKASGLETHFFRRWAGQLSRALTARQDLALTTRRLAAIPSLLSAVATALVLAIGSLRVMDGGFTVGMLVAFLSLMQGFLGPINGLVGLGGVLQELQGDVNRLDDVLRHPVDPEVAAPRRDDDGGRLEGLVEFRAVTFGYNPVQPPLLDGFSFRLEPGRRVAVVGPSGSGKSTVARLVCGLYEPWKGEVRFDGRLRRELSRPHLSRSVAMVEQDVFLFEGTVRENLTLWDATVPTERVVRACRDAAIHEDILALPGGYEAPVGEGGSNLSGGQRQRMEIARALVRDPAVLVLDEATSALDAETELVIDRNLRRRGCSCLVVAHRLSTIRDSDEIIVLREGRVEERGTHDELLQAGGSYARLVSVDGEALAPSDGAAESPC